MPSFTVDTNVPNEKIPDSFLTELSALLCQLLGKPEKYMNVTLNAGLRMTFAGNQEPCAICTLVCIGKIGLEENKRNTKELMTKLNKDLGISGERMYIIFNEKTRQDVGWNMTTFA